MPSSPWNCDKKSVFELLWIKVWSPRPPLASLLAQYWFIAIGDLVVGAILWNASSSHMYRLVWQNIHKQVVVRLSWKESCISNMTYKPTKLGHTDPLLVCNQSSLAHLSSVSCWAKNDCYSTPCCRYADQQSITKCQHSLNAFDNSNTATIH